MTIIEADLVLLVIIAVVVVVFAVTRQYWQIAILRFWQTLLLFKSGLYIVARVVLAFGISLLTWLCVQQAVAIAHLKRDLIHVLQGSPRIHLSLDSPKSHILGFLWQYPVALSVCAVCIAVATLLYLFLSKAQHRAVMVAAVALAVLLVQLLVVAPAVAMPAVQLREKLQIL